jgi:phage terminase small subunit
MAYKLLQKPAIKAQIQQFEEQAHRKFEITHDRLTNELAKIAFGDIRDVMIESGTGLEMKPWVDIDTNDSATIKAVRESHTEHGTSRSIERYDKIKAIDLLGRNKGLWNGNNDGDGADKNPRAALAERVSAALRKRAGSGGEG